MISLVGFVRLYMRAGRRWLAWTVCGLRTLSLALNFLFTPNVNFREITGFRTVPFLGEAVNVAEGVRNPWMLIGQLSLLLLLIFVVDATLTVWRRGDRRSMVVLGASIAFFFGASTLQFVLGLWGIVAIPLTPSLFFMGIVAAMSFELSRDVLHASVLAGELRESEQRMALATDAANLGLWVRVGSQNELWANETLKVMLGFAPGETVMLDAVLRESRRFSPCGSRARDLRGAQQRRCAAPKMNENRGPRAVKAIKA
jgi:PAS domain-containing protein